MLLTLGFANSWVRKHDQFHRHGHDPTAPKVAMPMFTVVATR